MTQRPRDDQNLAMLDALIEEMTVDARGDDETLRAFRQAFEDHIVVPCDAFVVGEPVSVGSFDYDGNARRGLTARCRRQDRAEHVVAAADVVLAPLAAGQRYLAAYRMPVIPICPARSRPRGSTRPPWGSCRCGSKSGASEPSGS